MERLPNTSSKPRRGAVAIALSGAILAGTSPSLATENSDLVTESSATTTATIAKKSAQKVGNSDFNYNKKSACEKFYQPSNYTLKKLARICIKFGHKGIDKQGSRVAVFNLSSVDITPTLGMAEQFIEDNSPISIKYEYPTIDPITSAILERRYRPDKLCVNSLASKIIRRSDSVTSYPNILAFTDQKQCNNNAWGVASFLGRAQIMKNNDRPIESAGRTGAHELFHNYGIGHKGLIAPGEFKQGFRPVFSNQIINANGIYELDLHIAGSNFDEYSPDCQDIMGRYCWDNPIVPKLNPYLKDRLYWPYKVLGRKYPKNYQEANTLREANIPFDQNYAVGVKLGPKRSRIANESIDFQFSKLIFLPTASEQGQPMLEVALGDEGLGYKRSMATLGLVPLTGEQSSYTFNISYLYKSYAITVNIVDGRVAVEPPKLIEN